MGVFITTTESLIPHAVNKAPQLSKEELEQHITAIMEVQGRCKEDNDFSLVNDRPVSKNLQDTIIKLLKRALTAAKDYNPTAQYSILQLLTTVVLNEETQTNDACMFYSAKHPSFLKEFGWDLLELLEPFMSSATGDEAMNAKVRRYATKTFRRIAHSASGKEVLMLALEKMSLMDWDAVASDEEKCVRSAIKIVEYFEIFGEAAEHITQPKKILNHIVYPAQFCAKTVGFLENVVRDHSSWGDRERPASRWDQVVFVLTNAILDFIEYGKNTTMVTYELFFNEKKEQRPELKDIGQDSDEVKRWYLAVYLLLLIFDKIVLNLDMDLTTIYTHRYRWEYNVKRPFESKSKTIEMYSSTGKNEMLDLVFRCTRIAKSLGLTFDGMLRLKRSLIDAKRGDNDERQTKDEREMINSNIFPISYDSITSLLAISVYDAYIFGQTFDVPSMNLLPMVLDYKWIGKECLGLILRLVGNAQRFAHVDKGLFLLIFLAKHVDITIDVQTLTESQLPGPLVGHQNFDLIQGLQVMSSVAAMCPNADLRYAAYQLISCFINMCANDAQLFVFMELFDSCPLETMRAAAVGLLKNQIVDAFKNKCEQNLFNSNVIADKLFPRLFKKPNTSTLWDRYGFEMQVLNLYLYLLIRDKPPSRSRVWDDDVIDWVKSTYLDPLEWTINELSRELQEPANNDQQSRSMQLSLLRNSLDQVKEQLENNNGKINQRLQCISPTSRSHYRICN